MPKLFAWFVSFVALALLAACSAHSVDGKMDPPSGLGDDDPSGTRSTADAGDRSPSPTGTCPRSNPFCGAPSDGAPRANPPGTSTDCNEQPIEVEPAGVNIMVAVQGSASMAGHWPAIKSAIRELRQRYSSASFGVHLFWANETAFNGQNTPGQFEPADPSMNGNKSNNFCETTQHKVLEVGDHSAAEIDAFLGDTPPSPSFALFYEPEPVIDALNYYLTNATKLADPERTNYLLFLTDGNDTCFGSFLIESESKTRAYEKVAVELRKKGIRTIPVGLNAMLVEPTVNQAVLQLLLDNGGSGLTSAPIVEDPAMLTNALVQVGQNAVNCRFEVPATANATAGAFTLNFSINGVAVPRDRRQTNGWDFVRGSTSRVEFFGQGCQALQTGQALRVTKSCDQNICGRAAASAQTKPRAILLLIGTSTAYLECIDGSIDCLIPPLDGPKQSLSYWEALIRAMSISMASSVNDDVEFGAYFFPSKNAAALTCDVAPEPEVVPAPGMQVAIMKQMLEVLPFGFNPIVAAMEGVAAAPGRLADPNVLGAVVVLNQGGEDCESDVAQSAVVSRLDAAAKKLADAGIKTYAIRYGSTASQTPEQSEQLATIVRSGGTALATGSMPYIDAKSFEDLNTTLATISDQLATCSFTLGGIAADVDKTQANLYMNGEAIGFDAMSKKQNGWDWVDPERTTVQLYGPACQAFKTNLRTNVVVEFGCEPIEVEPLL